MEHPFYGSWGYQTTGFFAPTRRYGDPQDLMALIDQLHQAGIGVILDWVPSHFPADAFAWPQFDGTHLYEHADPRLGFHPDWKSLIFNYGRHEVRSFLASSAEHWLSARTTPTGCGSTRWPPCSTSTTPGSRASGSPTSTAAGRTSRRSPSCASSTPGSTPTTPTCRSSPRSRPPCPACPARSNIGGLGFGLKWDMGWMHDTLEYLSRDPIHRRYHHGELTFRSVYAFSENFMLPLSHDEVVHGKGSLLAKMPGDDWQRFANLRLLYGYQFATPGKKLLFMGAELAQWREWDHDGRSTGTC